MNQPVLRGERGNFALLGAISLALMLGFAALVIDVGYLYWIRTHEYNTAEAAATAAARELDGTPAGIVAACDVAVSLVAQNDTEDEFAFDAATEISFGDWDETTGTFNTLGVSCSNTLDGSVVAADSVRVLIQRSPDKQNGVAPLLSSVFSIFSGQAQGEFAVAGAAIAFAPQGPPTAASIFPMAVSACKVKQGNGTGAVNCDAEIVIGDDPGGSFAEQCPHIENPSAETCLIDSSGNHFNWTIGSTSTDWGTDAVRTLANNLLKCLTQSDSAACAASQTTIGSTIAIKGGNHAGAFESDEALFDGDFLNANGPLTVFVPVFMPESCLLGTGGGTTTAEIVGFAALRIMDIVKDGPKRYIRAVVDCDPSLNGLELGGVIGDDGLFDTIADFGVTTPGPAQIVE